MRRPSPYRILRENANWLTDVSKLKASGVKFAPYQLSPKDAKLFYAVLMCDSEYSFLPDLFAAINEDVDLMTRLLHVFCGLQITFPTPGLLEATHNEMKIYKAIEATPESERPSMYWILEGEFEKDGQTLRKIYARIKTIVEMAGLRSSR